MAVAEISSPISAGTSVDIGFGKGQGHTVNVNWAEKCSTGDSEYVAAISAVVSPILKSFRADCVILRTNLGSHQLTPAGYAYIVHLLYRAAHGRVCGPSEMLLLGLLTIRLPSARVLSLSVCVDRKGLCSCSIYVLRW